MPKRNDHLTDTISIRVTRQERVVLEQCADIEHRTLSNYVRKQLRSMPTADSGAEERQPVDSRHVAA